MNSKQAPIIGLIVCLLAATGLIWLIFTKNNNNAASASNNEIILFYSDTCPHCKNVEDFIRQNNIDLKLTITRKEVSYNIKNGELLAEKAAKCGLATNRIGVPLLWNGKICYSGDEDVINFLIGASNLQ